MLEMQGLGGLGGFQEKANCPPLDLDLDLTHPLTMPLAAVKMNKCVFNKCTIKACKLFVTVS